MGLEPVKGFVGLIREGRGTCWLAARDHHLFVFHAA
jgi:hypothetical protein